MNPKEMTDQSKMKMIAVGLEEVSGKGASVTAGQDALRAKGTRSSGRVLSRSSAGHENGPLHEMV